MCEWQLNIYFIGWYRTSCKMNYEKNSNLTKDTINKGKCPFCKRAIIIK